MDLDLTSGSENQADDSLNNHNINTIQEDGNESDYEVNEQEDLENDENNGKKSTIQLKKRRRNLADVERQLAMLNSELESDLFEISMIKKELKSTKKSQKQLTKTIKKKKIVKKEMRKLAQSFAGLLV